MRISFLFILLFTSISFEPADAAPRTSFTDSTHITQKTRLWTEPTKFGEPVAIVEPGLEVEIESYSSSGSWMKVKTPTGREGWVLVRYTALSGRREDPLVKSSPEESRRPASEEDGEKEILPVETKTKNVDLYPHHGLFFSGGYANQLSHDFTSGFGLGVAYGYDLNRVVYIGAGLNWNMFMEKATSVAAAASTERISHRILPHALVGLIYKGMVLDLGLGLDLDHTTLDSRDATTGAAIDIVTDPVTGAPLKASGSESRLAFGAKVGLGFGVDISPASFVGFRADYFLTIEGNATGDFASAGDTGSISQSVAGGLLYRFRF